MARDQRRGVSTYIETFILIGIAVGGSAMAYSALGGYAASAGGPSVEVPNIILSQGSGAAVEKVMIANTGTASFNSFTVSTTGVSSSLQYCAVLSDATGRPLSFSSPPPVCGSGTTTNPSYLSINPSIAIPPGQTVILSLVVFSSGEFVVGSNYSVTVSTGPALQVVTATAVPG